MGSRHFIKSLARGLCILEAVADSSRSLSLTEISAIVELDKSTVFGFLQTLEELGYLERDAESKLYRPGLKVLNLGFACLNSRGIIEIARPYLKSLSDECTARTDLSILDGIEVVTVALERVPWMMDIGTHVGSRFPVHCTSSGKAQVLDLCRAELVRLLGEGPYPKWAPNTITTLDGLLAELEVTRQRGYAISDEELAAGLRAAAAPIRDRDGRIVGAVCISVPTAIATRQQLEASLAPKVIRSARQISMALGVEFTEP